MPQRPRGGCPRGRVGWQHGDRELRGPQRHGRGGLGWGCGAEGPEGVFWALGTRAGPLPLLPAAPQGPALSMPGLAELTLARAGCWGRNPGGQGPGGGTGTRGRHRPGGPGPGSAQLSSPSAGRSSWIGRHGPPAPTVGSPGPPRHPGAPPMPCARGPSTRHPESAAPHPEDDGNLGPRSLHPPRVCTCWGGGGGDTGAEAGPGCCQTRCRSSDAARLPALLQAEAGGAAGAKAPWDPRTRGVGGPVGSGTCGSTGELAGLGTYGVRGPTGSGTCGLRDLWGRGPVGSGTCGVWGSAGSPGGRFVTPQCPLPSRGHSGEPGAQAK